MTDGPYRESAPKSAAPAVSPVANFIAGAIVYGAMLGIGIWWVTVVFVPQSMRLAAPAMCPAGTRSSSVLLTDGMDYTHGAKPVVNRTLMCRDAAGHDSPAEPLLGDLEIDLFLALYALPAGMVLVSLIQVGQGLRQRMRGANNR
jgi:hypothetical protein